MRLLRFSAAPWLFGALLTSGVVGLLPGCDVIDQPIPLQSTVSAGKRDSVALDSAEAVYLALPGHNVPVQRVLLEDFTGHTCGNCPAAARIAARLDSVHGEKLVVVAIHTGYFADTTRHNYEYDFRTPAGEELNQKFGLDLSYGLPQGTVNRAVPAGNSSFIIRAENWTSAVSTQLARQPEQRLVVTALPFENSNDVRIKVSAKYLTPQPGHTYRLVLNVLEDSLREWQIDYSLRPNPTDVPNYLHRHILRDTPLGTFGQVNVVNPTAGQLVETYMRYTLPDKPWARRSRTLVAYLLDEASELKNSRVVQVAETHL